MGEFTAFDTCTTSSFCLITSSGGSTVSADVETTVAVETTDELTVVAG